MDITQKKQHLHPSEFGNFGRAAFGSGRRVKHRFRSSKWWPWERCSWFMCLCKTNLHKIVPYQLKSFRVNQFFIHIFAKDFRISHECQTFPMKITIGFDISLLDPINIPYSMNIFHSNRINHHFSWWKAMDITRFFFRKIRPDIASYSPCAPTRRDQPSRRPGTPVIAIFFYGLITIV